MMMFVVVDKHVVDGHLHVDAGALLLPRLAHNVFHWGSWVFIIFIFFSHNIFHLGSLVFIISSFFSHNIFHWGSLVFIIKPARGPEGPAR